MINGMDPLKKRQRKNQLVVSFKGIPRFILPFPAEHRQELHTGTHIGVGHQWVPTMACWLAGKWKQRLVSAVRWWSNFDPHPYSSYPAIFGLKGWFVLVT